jgi:hypothetical protein
VGVSETVVVPLITADQVQIRCQVFRSPVASDVHVFGEEYRFANRCAGRAMLAREAASQRLGNAKLKVARL